MTHFIYLSPHLDDAVFSCGGLIRDQVDHGHTVEIWTICAGNPPDGPLSEFAQTLHDRWGLGRDAVSMRRAEDVNACARVGAVHRHFNLPDCIYRRDPVSLSHFYTSDFGIFADLAELEVKQLAPELASSWKKQLREGAVVVSPLGFGGHVDHKLVRIAADLMQVPLQYYADTPYVLVWEAELPGLLPENTRMTLHAISDDEMQAWVEANAAYESQISTFWGSVEEMETVFRGYAALHGGIRIWQKEG